MKHLQEPDMSRLRWSSFAALVAVSLALAAAPPPASAQAPIVTFYEGARLLTGDGGVIEDSAFIVANDRFVGVGRRGQLQPPPGAARVDLAGKTVMPALVDDHVHMGYRSGTSFSAVRRFGPNKCVTPRMMPTKPSAKINWRPIGK